MHSPEFKVIKYDDESEGQFVWGEDRDSLFEKHYDALEALETGKFDEARAELEQILEIDSDFIDAYNSLASILRKEGKLVEAIQLYEQAVQIGERLIPKDFSGRIIWGDLDNRPFLRALHGKGVCSLKFAKYRKAIDSFEQLLEYNPNDNQGARYLLGEAHLKAGNMNMAEETLAKNVDYPPNRYSYAFVLIEKKKYIEAITELRKAFMENIYVAELLLKKYPVVKYDIRHGSNYSEPEIALEYMRSNHSLWKESPGINFMEAVFENPTVQNQIVEMFMLKEKISQVSADSTEGIERRMEIIREEEELMSSINHDTSKGIKDKVIPIKSGT